LLDELDRALRELERIREFRKQSKERKAAIEMLASSLVRDVVSAFLR
jgi:hypothetical protein